MSEFFVINEGNLKNKSYICARNHITEKQILKTMKTKKNWSILALMMLVLGAFITLASCSKDDDDETGGSSSSLAGTTWKYSDEYGEITTTMTFKKDGEGTVNQKGDYGSGAFNDNYEMTYHMTTDNEGMITVPEGVDFDGYSDYYTVMYFVVEGKSMYLYSSGNYSNKTMIVTMKKN